ncbi:HET-like protein [Colletotrichum scovillei]|uniref:HET-like protein n=1 Tax=Colletotrichum scovillei TaxID=1209932 RepID=A0A9P7R537_9PEZI|nr:HET-like protein [Colletotrichum scovillei]KAG7066090.1 HET-like protein [Colletotrichum scovillei]KAG7068654.1 HET-like protein [Colletotrichum scovillei]
MKAYSCMGRSIICHMPFTLFTTLYSVGAANSVFEAIPRSPASGVDNGSNEAWSIHVEDRYELLRSSLLCLCREEFPLESFSEPSQTGRNDPGFVILEGVEISFKARTVERCQKSSLDLPLDNVVWNFAFILPTWSFPWIAARPGIHSYQWDIGSAIIPADEEDTLMHDPVHDPGLIVAAASILIQLKRSERVHKNVFV